jgi:phage recombination protein Bet
MGAGDEARERDRRNMPETGLTTQENQAMRAATMGSTIGGQQAVAIREKLGWTPDEIQVIKNSLVPGASDAVLKYYLAAASVMRLNPLLKEIHIVPYGDETKGGVKWVLQTGIDGFVRHAWESGRFQGFRPTMFVVRDKDGRLSEVPMKWYDPDSGFTIMSATVSAVLIGSPEPIEATCHFKRYAKVNDKGDLLSTWKTIPERLIEKCCQAKFIRENFPGRSGVYTAEEMGNLDELEGIQEKAQEPVNRVGPRTRQRRLQHPVAPTQTNTEPIETTATVVEADPVPTEQTEEDVSVTPPVTESQEPSETDGDPAIVAYLKRVTDGMRDIYKVPPDGIHHMNRLIKHQFEVDEPWMIPGDNLEALTKYCKGALLVGMQSGEWIPERGKK